MFNKKKNKIDFLESLNENQCFTIHQYQLRIGELEKENKIDFLESLNENQCFTIHQYQLRIEELEKENKKMIEDFVKTYDYVLLNKGTTTHFYQKGVEINRIQSMDFDQNASGIPTINIEVR